MTFSNEMYWYRINWRHLNTHTHRHKSPNANSFSSIHFSLWYCAWDLVNWSKITYNYWYVPLFGSWSFVQHHHQWFFSIINNNNTLTIEIEIRLVENKRYDLCAWVCIEMYMFKIVYARLSRMLYICISCEGNNRIVVNRK